MELKGFIRYFPWLVSVCGDSVNGCYTKAEGSDPLMMNVIKRVMNIIGEGFFFVGRLCDRLQTLQSRKEYDAGLISIGSILFTVDF